MAGDEVTLGDIVGPGTLPCEEECEVPDGITMTGVPVPRHAWGDVLVCPNGCGRAWLVRETGSASLPSVEAARVEPVSPHGELRPVHADALRAMRASPL